MAENKYVMVVVSEAALAGDHDAAELYLDYLDVVSKAFEWQEKKRRAEDLEWVTNARADLDAALARLKDARRTRTTQKGPHKPF